MAEETQAQDGQKTLVAFVVGLLIGGMLVWAFSGPTADAPTNGAASETTEETGDEDATDATQPSPDESATNTDAAEDDTEQADTSTPLPVGDGSVTVNDQPASSAIAIERATYPVSEGWIGVREYNDGQLGFILGVVRFSESQGLTPEQIVLQRPTVPGEENAVVIFTEDGDFDFSLANDVQIDEIYDTFTAQ